MRLAFLALAAVASVAAAVAAPRASRTSITVWGGTATGGATYGGLAAGTGALVVERRDVEIAGDAIALDGVSHALDPASVQLRDLTEPTLGILQQRFVAGALTPTEMIARHRGEPVTVVTPRGEVTGTLRAVDDATLAIEVGAKLEILRRDYVQSMRMPVGNDRALLAWRVGHARPGPHAIEISYRTDLMTWSADYLAVLDEAGTALDFSAWATVRNTTGASFDDAQLTLVGAGQARFEVPALVHLAGADAVQVELMPARRGAKTRALTVLDALADSTITPGDADTMFDCTQNALNVGAVTVALELDLPATPLPDGRVRVFRRAKDRLEVVGEDDFHPVPGHTRLKLAGDSPIAGRRATSACVYDEQAKTLREKVEIVVENIGKQALDVAVHDQQWRGRGFRIDGEQPAGTAIAPAQREYRLRVPAGGRQTIAYTVSYQW